MIPLTERELFERQFVQEMNTRQFYSDTKLKLQQDDTRRVALFWQRRRIFDQEVLRHQDEPVIMQLAWGLASFLLERDIWFENDTLAGVYAHPEYRHSLPFSLSEAYRLYMADPQLMMDEPVVDEMIRMFAVGFGGGFSGLHVVGGFGRALRLGVGGMRRELQECIKKMGETEFLRAGILVLDAVKLYFHRVADQAKMLAVRRDTDPVRKQPLIAMAKACDWVASYPPETFREAIQLIVLLHEVISTEERCGSLSFGRFDKMLYPYYSRDIAAGILTKEQAQDMIDSFWSILAENRWGWQQITLGGWDSQDGYCCNDITRMCLDASKRIRRDQPQLSFRWHPTMPVDLWEDVIDLLKQGMGFPSIFNDEQCILAKQQVGIAKEDAENYGVLGCVEVTIPEKEFSHTEGLRINWPKTLEVALHGGVDVQTGEYFAPKNPRKMDSFVTFEDFWIWFQGEFVHYADIMARGMDEMHIAFGYHYPIPFMSVTMYGPAETGLDVTRGGAVYNHSCINNAGQANMVDSLAAIEKFVFQEKRFSLPKLVQMLAADFCGFENERYYIKKNALRFGSDTRCTELMDEIHRIYCHYLVNLPNKRGGVHEVGYYSMDAHVSLGKSTGALPDGRLSGETLANGTAPIQGTEKHGPLTVLQAVASYDATYLGNGMALDMKFLPSFFDIAENRDKFRKIVEIFFQQGGMQLQVNVVDPETLKRAQAHPDQYKNLIVRVSGFSAYFVDLSKGVQDEIISRTTYGV